MPCYPIALSETNLESVDDDSVDGIKIDNEEYADIGEGKDRLNKDHSHFLFVDSPGDPSLEKEINFRTNFEEYLIRTEAGRYP